MSIWLCPIKPRSWRITKAKRLFGVPKRQLGIFYNVKPDDVLKPVDGIVSACRVVSEVFENHEDIWGKDRYPLRVRLELIPSMLQGEGKPTSLSAILGKGDRQSEIEIEPYLKNVWITEISERQCKNLQRPFAKRTRVGTHKSFATTCTRSLLTRLYSVFSSEEARVFYIKTV